MTHTAAEGTESRFLSCTFPPLDWKSKQDQRFVTHEPLKEEFEGITEAFSEGVSYPFLSFCNSSFQETLGSSSIPRQEQQLCNIIIKVKLFGVQPGQSRLKR